MNFLLKTSPLLFLLLLLNCNSTHEEASKEKSKVDSLPLPKKKETFNTIYIKKISLEGDFNGDKKTDTLFTKLISKAQNKEIDSIKCRSHDEFVYILSDELDVYLEIASKSLKPLKVDKNGQIAGLLKLVNLGDIDKNKTDEIAFIVDWADWSDINDCHIYSYCGESWKKIGSFPIRESNLNLDETKENDIQSILEKKQDGWYYKVYVDSIGEDLEKKIKTNGC